MSNPSNKKEHTVGEKHNRCTLIKEIESKTYKDGSVIRKGLFKCDCGKEFTSDLNKVSRGHTKSCGCWKIEKFTRMLTKHGKSKSPEYICWNSMKDRCYNINNFQFKDYGGRGITVCERWKNNFSNFLEDLGDRPSLDYSLDRIDVNGNYCKENCRWADKFQQANNKRDNVYITHSNGDKKTLTEWARIANLHRVTLKYRLWKGMSIEEAITKPADERFTKTKKEIK